MSIIMTGLILDEQELSLSAKGALWTIVAEPFVRSVNLYRGDGMMIVEVVWRENATITSIERQMVYSHLLRAGFNETVSEVPEGAVKVDI